MVRKLLVVNMQIHFHRTLFRLQKGKSSAHVQFQRYLKLILPDLLLEKKIIISLDVHRIADGCWEKEKLVFEIQCSPISLKEAKDRSLDYMKAGYTPVWILHDKKFNKRRLSLAEAYLRKQLPTFFTNGGEVYDQFDICQNRNRLLRGPKLTVDLRMPKRNFSANNNSFSRSWPLYFHGDFLHLVKTEGASHLAHLKKIEKRILRKHRRTWWKKWSKIFIYRILERTTE